MDTNRTTELADDQTISRYMSLAKFLDVLKNGRLYFSSLASFIDDKHEGSSTLLNALVDTGFAAALDAAVNYSFPAALGVGLPPEERDALREKGRQLALSRPTLHTAFGPFLIDSEETYRRVLEGQRRWLDASCWHLGDDESLAMWKIYGGSNEAVALKTTVGRLRRAVQPQQREVIAVEPVHYIDHRNEHFQSDHVLAPALHKQKPYAYEREVRAIVWNAEDQILEGRGETGRAVHVDLIELVSGVRLSPKAPLWFLNLVQGEVSRVTSTIKVEQSLLDGDPVMGYSG